MSNLDLWIVNVAFVAIGNDLGGSVASLSWVLNAYAVALAALVVPFGRWGDRVGHRPVFLGGILLFTVASLLCAVAPTLPLLVAARALQAAGAAAQLPTSLALLMAAVPAERRTHAARQWSAVGAVAAVCGPVAGGLLVTIDWRWVFIVNVPIGLVTLLVGRRVLPHPPARTDEPMPDLVGTALLTVTVTALTAALVEAPSWGWSSGRVVGLGAVAAVGAVAFLIRALRHTHPVIELHHFRVRQFAVGNACVFAFSAGFAIMLLSNSLWCQEVWHYSVLTTGFALAPGPLVVPFVTQWSARLVARWGMGPVIALGGVVFAAGLLWRVLFAGPTPAYATELLPSMLLTGAGVGLALSTSIAAGATALASDRSATASGTVNSVRQVASCLGVAVLVTVLGSGGDPLTRYEQSWSIAIALSLVAAGLGLALAGRRTGSGAGAREQRAVADPAR